VFDDDDTGFISAENLESVLTKSGKEVTTEELQEMITSVDLEHNGYISFEEFCKMMLKSFKARDN
jgi:Ca2+-binding EF-hand superfamily protein